VDEELAAWCRDRLGAEPEAVLFRAGYLSEVTGLRLADGREVVVKARPPAPRLRGCLAVQAALAGAGFPCPRPLAGPAPLGRLDATAEELVPGGDLLAPGPDAAGRFARLLAELVRLAPSPAAVPTLRPSPPWAAWDHDHPGLWPPPDDRDGNLDDHPGPAWLDRVAATVSQTEQFLTGYEEARGRPWTAAERQASWAAGLWVRAFNAKKERLAGGGPQVDRLAAEVGERAARAGLEVAGGA
jgi:hypothetical protein